MTTEPSALAPHAFAASGACAEAGTTPAETTLDATRCGPVRQLGVRHAISVCVGMVIGAGIFKTSPTVAGNVMTDTALFLAWAFGGLLSLAGALCFAEMAAAFPDAGGDYFFLRTAYGRRIGFLFAWSRFAVIHTGSMALLAFVFGDYLAQVVNFGPYSSAGFGTAAILTLTLLNLKGIRLGIGTQVGLMILVLFGLVCVGFAGAWEASHGHASATPFVHVGPDRTDIGAALVFVFLAYGGWSDAATLSSEMRDARRGIVWALIGGMSIVTVLYLLANWGYVRVLGLDGLAGSQAPAADLMLRAFGKPGELLIVAVVAVTSISVMNALLIAGARTTYAAARDVPGLTVLGAWDSERGTPAHAVIAMGCVALLLVGFGTLTRGGFATMVDYLSPVYWCFLSLSGAAVLVLRWRYPDTERPFKVPGYPLIPIAFVASSLYVLASSLDYVRTGAWVGVLVLAVGAVLLWPLERWHRAQGTA